MGPRLRAVRRDHGLVLRPGRERFQVGFPNQTLDDTGQYFTDGDAQSRPERRNAVDRPTAAALAEAFLAFDHDPEANVAVFYGESGEIGRASCRERV